MSRGDQCRPRAPRRCARSRGAAVPLAGAAAGRPLSSRPKHRRADPLVGRRRGLVGGCAQVTSYRSSCAITRPKRAEPGRSPSGERPGPLLEPSGPNSLKRTPYNPRPQRNRSFQGRALGPSTTSGAGDRSHHRPSTVGARARALRGHCLRRSDRAWPVQGSNTVTPQCWPPVGTGRDRSGSRRRAPGARQCPSRNGASSRPPAVHRVATHRHGADVCETWPNPLAGSPTRTAQASDARPAPGAPGPRHGHPTVSGCDEPERRASGSPMTAPGRRWREQPPRWVPSPRARAGRA